MKSKPGMKSITKVDQHTNIKITKGILQSKASGNTNGLTITKRGVIYMKSDAQIR